MKEELRSLRSLQDGDENVCVGVEFNFAAHALTLELRVALNATAVVSSTTQVPPSFNRLALYTLRAEATLAPAG
jgi:hypothetical protein